MSLPTKEQFENLRKKRKQELEMKRLKERQVRDPGRAGLCEPRGLGGSAGHAGTYGSQVHFLYHLGPGLMLFCGNQIPCLFFSLGPVPSEPAASVRAGIP